LHFQWYALGLQSVDAETPTLEEALACVARQAETASPGAWINGFGWNHNVWHLSTPDGFPTAADLDHVSPDHPIILNAKSGHALWANSRALQLAGITASTPDPAGGQIVRDKHGQPTGILLEGAIDLIDAVHPAPTAEQVAEAMRAAFPLAQRAGLTGIHCFDGPEALAAYQMLRCTQRQQRGELGLRVVKSIPREKLDHALALGLRSGFGDDWLRIGSIKMFADGALGPQTAWMLEPFENSTSTGIATLDEKEMADNVRRANTAGLSCAIHAIGDRACRTVLDVYEEVGSRSLRNRPTLASTRLQPAGQAGRHCFDAAASRHVGHAHRRQVLGRAQCRSVRLADATRRTRNTRIRIGLPGGKDRSAARDSRRRHAPPRRWQPRPEWLVSRTAIDR
jgi:predicted amidohydrolase YtcJ